MDFLGLNDTFNLHHEVYCKLQQDYQPADAAPCPNEWSLAEESETSCHCGHGSDSAISSECENKNQTVCPVELRSSAHGFPTI